MNQMDLSCSEPTIVRLQTTVLTTPYGRVRSCLLHLCSLQLFFVLVRMERTLCITTLILMWQSREMVGKSK